MLNRTSTIVKLPKPFKYSLAIGEEQVTRLCDYMLYPKNTHLRIPLESDDVEQLHQQIQDILMGHQPKVTA